MAGLSVFTFAFLNGLLLCSSTGLVGNIFNGETNNTLGITFKLYNRIYPKGVNISPYDSEVVLTPTYISGKGCKIITHGYQENARKDSVVTVRTAYSRTSDYNLIAVDWSPLAKSEYVVVTLKAPQIGKVIAELVVRLIQYQLATVDDFHLIGHSLGSHVVGFAGAYVTSFGYGKVKRISALDPAGPFYEGLRGTDQRLNKEDAQFVDVIHTSIGVLGFKEAIGHVDFYPNGGYNNQPGCTLNLNILCGHQRSYLLFAESIYNEHAFPSVQCDSYESFKANKCVNWPIVFMGNPVPLSVRGKYFLDTNFTGTSISSGLIIN